MTQTLSHASPNVASRKWQALLGRLADDIQTWASADGWAVKRKQITLNLDSQWGPYDAPSLQLRKGKRKLTIEPIAQNVVGADGLVEIRGRYAFRKLLLARKGSSWKIFTEDRIPWPESWGETGFVHLAEALTSE